MKNNTTLIMVATAIITSAFMMTAVIWHQQQTQAMMESKSRSISCVDNQPCHSSVTNSSTPPPTLAPSPASILMPHSSTSTPSPSSSTSTPSPASSTSTPSPASSKLHHHNFHSSTMTTSHPSALNSTESLSDDYRSIANELSNLTSS
jgi:hypothetical protein